MKVREPLLWHEGLFLRPQHFQLQDQVNHSILAPLLAHGLPHFWGVGQLTIDESALETGVLFVESGAFLFPDGTYAVLGENASIEGRVLPEEWPDRGEELTVLAGVRSWSDDANNVTVCREGESGATVATRFVHRRSSRDEEFSDEEEIKRVTLLLRLFWETEVPGLGDYHLIPLVKLQRSGTRVSLVGEYVPPSLSLASSSALSALVRITTELVTARCSELRGVLRPGGGAGELKPQDVARVLASQALHRHLPVLRHALEDGRSAPWQVYGTLQQLAAELAAGSAPSAPEPELPPYDHHDSGRCFRIATEAIRRVLEAMRVGPSVILPLVHDGCYFCTELPGSLLADRYRLILAARTAFDPDPVAKGLATSAKVSSPDHLPHLTTKALPGIRLSHLVSPPGELPRRPGTVYLALDRTDRQWAMLERAGVLALHWSDAPADLELELMVLDAGG